MSKLDKPQETSTIYSIQTWADGHWNAHSFTPKKENALEYLKFSKAQSAGPHRLIEEIKNIYQ